MNSVELLHAALLCSQRVSVHCVVVDLNTLLLLLLTTLCITVHTHDDVMMMMMMLVMMYMVHSDHCY